jgi:hypothetical protein
VAALALEDAAPELLCVGVEDVVDARRSDEPVLARELGVELARSPAGVAGERARPPRDGEEVGDLAPVAHEADRADDRQAGVGRVVELAEDEQGVGLDGTAGVDDGVLTDQLGELGRDIADEQVAAPVEDEAERALVGVLADQDDRAREVRVG